MLDAVGTDDDGLEVELGQRGAASDRGQDRGEERVAEVVTACRSRASSAADGIVGPGAAGRRVARP